MVHRSVEVHFIFFGSIDLDLIQFFVPASSCLFPYFIKIPSRHFCAHIFQCIFLADRRQCKFDLHFLLLSSFEIKIHSYVLSGKFRKVLGLVKFTPETSVCLFFIVILLSVAFKWLRECHGEIYSSGSCPSVGLTITGNQGIVYHTYIRPDIFIIVIIDSGH